MSTLHKAIFDAVVEGLTVTLHNDTIMLRSPSPSYAIDHVELDDLDVEYDAYDGELLALAEDFYLTVTTVDKRGDELILSRIRPDANGHRSLIVDSVNAHTQGSQILVTLWRKLCR